jgi:uncharacterized protein (DUF58 family)
MLLKVPCFEDLEFSFTIINNSFLPVFNMYIVDNIEDMLVVKNSNVFLIDLQKYEQRKLSYSIRPQKRGKYVISPIHIKISDPLNFFTLEKDFDLPLTVYVRPAKIKISNKFTPGFPQGAINIQNKIYEDISMRKAIREYTPGDELKKINWKISAKYNSLYTNEYQNTYEIPVFIFLNLAKNDYKIHTCYQNGERAIEIAAALVTQAQLLNQPCGIAIYGSEPIYMVPKKNQASQILDILSIIMMEDGHVDYNPKQKFSAQLKRGTLFYDINPKFVENNFSTTIQ